MIKLEDYKGMFIYGVKDDDEVLVESDDPIIKEYVEDGYKLYGSKKINIYDGFAKKVRNQVLEIAGKYDLGLKEFLEKENEEIEKLNGLEKNIEDFVKSLKGLAELRVIDTDTEITL